MQPQDATTLYFFKLWPWIEANKTRIIAGAVVVAIAALIIWFMVNQRESKQIAAGQALTQAAFAGSGPLPEAFMKVATDYPGTIAGQRALLQSAAALFEAGKFPDARARFQEYLDAHPDGEFSGQALLGVATSLDAQGKRAPAASAYQQVINSASEVAVINAAKYGLARIDESQGKLNDALVLYQDVANTEARGSLGSEAAMRLIALRSKLPATAPTTTNTATSPVPSAPLVLKTNQ